ncbi:Myb-like transcription factor family protein [Thalictrum thalictroides]|uniref:Myb-like transcription factor family protein n=1 Tax=Thalictrum thalictroides TaxID=46969 RepID=A0A7J6WZS9_THATH|nr:Myb-like transcription factor family protein [Thalictrum thalictroides]
MIAKKDDGSAATTIETILPRNGGGAFVPFKGFTGFLTSTRMEEKEKKFQLEAGLSLVTSGVKKPRTEPTTSCLMNSKTCVGSRGLPSSSIENTRTNLQMPLQSQPPRKQRRCWSADLHRRFLHALQQLGGSQVATPKQIRELMKVDGLTNDEVKSHLQKYRLHTRRFPANASSPGPENQKLAPFGGLWASEDQCGASKASTSQSESPQGPLHLMTSGGSTTGDDSMEDDEEDGKSESYTWKGHFYKPGDDEA